MSEGLILNFLQYAGYCLEFALLVLLLRRGYARRLASLCMFVIALLAVDAGARPWSLHRYGWHSPQYRHFYWLTELVLVTCAFLLICAFFRRAFAPHREVWIFLRPVLGMVLVGVLAVSYVTFTQHYHQLSDGYISEFTENLDFTCVVLTTVLYVMLEWIDRSDSQLHLLVCGLGIQYAGSAAGAALLYLTRANHTAWSFFTYLSPMCALAMLAVWLYAVAREPRGSHPLAGANRGMPAAA